jgi:hypothetical protein
MHPSTHSLARVVVLLTFSGTMAAAYSASDVTEMSPSILTAVPSIPVTPKSKADKLTAADREKIQRVINLQIRAFERNDEAIAFSYSSPESRRHFGTPRAFMDAVRVGYSALYRNTSRQFLEAATIDGITIQPMRVITANGETIVAFYTMEQQTDQEWRVGGCELSSATNTSA